MDGNDELDTREEGEDAPSVDYARKKRRVKMLLLGYSAIFGVINCSLPENDSVLDIIVGLPLLILMISWCFTDGAERDHRIGRTMRLLLILLFIVGFPIYLLQTRGFGGFKTLGLTLLFVAAMIACMWTAGLITLFIGDVTGLWEVDWTA